MSDVLQPPVNAGLEQAQASANPGGVASRGLPPSHERLQRRMSGYRERAKDHMAHLEATTENLHNVSKEDTKKLIKKHLDNAKPKKQNKKVNNMKPQINQSNGLKRPHPQNNDNNVGEAKRMNLENNVKIEVKQEDTVINNLKDEKVNVNDVKVNVKPEIKQENNNGNANTANNDSAEVSLNDFELDLENADFQDLISDISDLNPDMLDFEFNDKSDFDDLGTAPPPAQGGQGGPPQPPTQNGPAAPPAAPVPPNPNRNLGDLNNQGAINNSEQAASEKLKFMAQQRQQHGLPPQVAQQQPQQPPQPPEPQQPQQFAPQQQQQYPHSSYNTMQQPQQRMMYPQQPQMYPHHAAPHPQMMPPGGPNGQPPQHMPFRHGIRPGIRPGNMNMPMGHMGQMGPMGPMMMSNGMGGPPHPVSLPTTPLPKSSGGNNSPNNNSNSISTSAGSTPTSSAPTPPMSARATPPASTAPSSTSSNTIVPNSSSSPNAVNGPPPRMPNVNMRMPMGAGPPPGAAPPMSGQMYGNNFVSDVRMRGAQRNNYRLGNPSASTMRQPMQVPQGPPGSQGPQGPPGGPGGPMSGPGGPMGGPGPMPGGNVPVTGPMTVPSGQQSPMGNPGNMPMMPNPNMRPQVIMVQL